MRRAHRLQNTALGAVILGELIFLIGHPLFGWGPQRSRLTSTPAPLVMSAADPPSARSLLRTLAERADARALQSPSSTGRFAYVQRQTWQLSDQATGGGRAGRPLTRTITSWRGVTGGGGREVTVAQTRSGSESATRTLPDGHAPPDLAADQTVLARRLKLGNPHRPAVAQIRAVVALNDTEPIPAAAQASILRLLARVPGLVNAGTTTDRAGRPGVAVEFTTVDATPEVKDTLVFDPDTGQLLEFDQTLVSGDAALNVNIGAVLAYTAYRRRGWVAALGDVPAPASGPQTGSSVTSRATSAA